jgi:RNA polymerase sigma factor (TIGR02999 family)
MSDGTDITRLLHEAAKGDAAAAQRLIPIVYEILRAIARRERRHARHDTLGTTALVNEAYLSLFAGREPDWADRRSFFAYAARTMRSVVVDHARRAAASKRGGANAVRVDDSALEWLADDTDPSRLIDFDRALATLAAGSPRLVEIVELHLFAGLEFGDIARCLGVAERTIYREWDKARAYLNAVCSDPCAS